MSLCSNVTKRKFADTFHIPNTGQILPALTDAMSSARSALLRSDVLQGMMSPPPKELEDHEWKSLFDKWKKTELAQFSCAESPPDLRIVCPENQVSPVVSRVENTNTNAIVRMENHSDVPSVVFGGPVASVVPLMTSALTAAEARTMQIDHAVEELFQLLVNEQPKELTLVEAELLANRKMFAEVGRWQRQRSVMKKWVPR